MPPLHLSLFIAFCCIHFVNAAFTLPTSFFEDVVQQNAQKTWCYYPAVGQTRAVSCAGDFTMVSLVHLNTTISIGYYAPDNTRYGGAEWSVPLVNPGRVTLCVSGRAQDGTYMTACMFVTADNSLPLGGDSCSMAIGQKNVTDGCYVSGQTEYTISSTLPTPTSTPYASSSYLRPQSISTSTSYASPSYLRPQSIGGPIVLIRTLCAVIILFVIVQATL